MLSGGRGRTSRIPPAREPALFKAGLGSASTTCPRDTCIAARCSSSERVLGESRPACGLSWRPRLHVRAVTGGLAVSSRAGGADELPYLARHEPWYSDLREPDGRGVVTMRRPSHRVADPGGASAYGLAGRDLREHGHGPPLTLVHLACGRDVFPGWINVDSCPSRRRHHIRPGPMRARALPIDDNIVDDSSWGQRVRTHRRTFRRCSELHRVAKPGLAS